MVQFTKWRINMNDKDVGELQVNIQESGQSVSIPGTKEERVETKKSLRYDKLPKGTRDKESNEKKVKDWAEDNIEQQSDPKEEIITMSRQDLIDLIKNPLGALTVDNEKDADFVHAYMQCGNVKEALLIAEYAPKDILNNKTSLTALANEMMKRHEIQAAISWCKAQRMDDMIIGRDEFADYLTQIIRSDIGDMVNEDGTLDITKIKKHGKAISTYTSCISKKGDVRISVKLRDPIKAAELLAKFENWDKRDASLLESGNLADAALEALKNESISVKVEESDDETNESNI
jgi:phage terminase small subunit